MAWVPDTYWMRTAAASAPMTCTRRHSRGESGLGAPLDRSCTQAVARPARRSAGIQQGLPAVLRLLYRRRIGSAHLPVHALTSATTSSSAARPRSPWPYPAEVCSGCGWVWAGAKLCN